MRSLVLAVSFGIALLFCRLARADDTTEQWRALGDGAVSLQSTTSTATGKKKSLLNLQVLDAKLANKGSAIAIYDGPFVMATLAVREGSAAVLMYRGGGTPFVKVALVDLATNKSKLVDLPRVTAADWFPTSAIACADADGFTVLWQEQTGPGSPLGGDVQATMATVKPDGTIVKKPFVAPIPWSLGAIVHDGNKGYVLAVRYDGAKADQTRINFVTLTGDGKPEQHPWWGARPAQVGEMQMIMNGSAPTVVYRTADSILSIAANKSTGSWGKEAEASTVLATKKASAPFAIRTRSGALELVQR